MDWREFLEKDSLDGKGANDKIKPTKWTHNNPSETTQMTPKQFLDNSAGARDIKTKKPIYNSGKITDLDDIHSGDPANPNKHSYGVDGGDEKHDGKYGYNSENKILNSGKDTRSNKERMNEWKKDDAEIFRGDELGDVEYYKRKLRRGDKMENPFLGHDGKQQVESHEGRHRSRAMMEEGVESIPVKTSWADDGDDHEKLDVKRMRGQKESKADKQLDFKYFNPKGDKEDTRHPIFGRKKSWEVWLEKVDESRPDGDDWNDRHLPVPKITIHEIKEDDSFEEKQRKLHQLSNYNDSQDMNDGLIRENEDIDNTKVKKLLKNNAIETSHKEDEKKHEWDGKFSSSTIRDDVKDDDDKAVSEEEPLDELTDGKLEEVEKLKSDVDKIITDLARKIKNPKRREDIVQRQAEQKVKETVTKAWELFLVNKIPMNQYDKQPQKKPNEKGLKPEPLTETVPIPNPKGSIDPDKKTVSRLNHETGKRESVFIKGKPSTNPETDIGGGRPEEPNVVGDLKHGSVNATAGGTGKITQENTNSILYNTLAEEEKEKEADNKTDDEVTISNDDTDHATNETAETPEEKRARIIRQFDRKKRDKKGKIIKSWEAWLEKGRWDSDESKKKEKESREAKNELDRIKEWASQPKPKKTQRGRQAAERDEENSGNKYPAKKRVPLTRVEGHTRHLVSTGDTLAGDYEPIDTKEGENSPTHDQYLKRTGRSDHQLRTGRKEQYITTDNAEKWKSWLEKENKPKKYSGLTPKQRKIQESIDSENDSDNQYYTKAWELWLEKNSIKPSRGQLREGNKPKDYEYRQGADMATMFGVNTNEFEFPQEPKNDFQSQSTGARHATRERNFIEEQKDKETKEKTPVSSPENPKNDKYTRDDIKVGHSTIPRDDQRTAETTKPANRIGMPDIRRRHQITNNLAEKLTSWEGWLEKMQGAGDARYGNQHLTGLDQKPVNNEEDEANILPEKEEKTDNKEEKQEETDNKPYKALGGE